MIYVDPLRKCLTTNETLKKYGNLWCHLSCDGNVQELHVFAISIGLKREWFQDRSVPHYDLVPSKRKLAVSNGATEVSAVELVKKCSKTLRKLKEMYSDKVD